MNSQHLRIIARCVTIGFVACAVQAYAQVVVIDDGFSFSPDPVNIIVGESVAWQDDGSGPYQIISDTGAWNSFFTSGGIRFIQTGTFAYHDDFGDFGTIIVTENVPPSVTITNPASNALFPAPATFAFSADAFDPDVDGLSDVQFFVGTNRVDDVFSSPFTTTVTNLPPGTYQLTAIAYDNLGASATNQITISVQGQGISLTAPQFVAGTFQFSVSGLTVGKTNVIQASTNPAITTGWAPLVTNVATATLLSFTNSAALSQRCFRVLQLP